MEYPKSTPKKWEEHKLKMDFSSVPLIFITIFDHFQSIAAVLEFFNLKKSLQNCGENKINLLQRIPPSHAHVCSCCSRSEKKAANR